MTTTPDVLALEAEANAAAQRLNTAKAAIIAQREANRQSYLGTVHELAAVAYDAELDKMGSARERKAAAFEAIKAAIAADPVWVAVMDYLQAEYEEQGFAANDLAANTGGLRPAVATATATAGWTPSNAFDLLRRIVSESRPVVTRGHDAMEAITAQARQASGFDHAGTPVVE